MSKRGDESINAEDECAEDGSVNGIGIWIQRLKEFTVNRSVSGIRLTRHMPVLYVAIGRRLGYPLELVTTKGHVFACWEDSNDRFNIEGTNEGLNLLFS